MAEFELITQMKSNFLAPMAEQKKWISFMSSIQFQLFFPQVAPVFLDLILERGLLGDNETLPACRLKRFLKEEHRV